MEARRTQPPSYPHTPRPTCTHPTHTPSYPHITHVIPPHTPVIPALTSSFPQSPRHTRTRPRHTREGGNLALRAGMTPGDLRYGGNPATMNQTTEPRCGLCDTIGIGRIELHGRNSSSRVIGPSVNILAPPDPKHDITR